MGKLGATLLGLEQIRGPDFLLLYAVLGLVMILFARWWVKQGGHRIQFDHRLVRDDLTTIAVLSGGAKKLVRATICGLLQRNKVQLADPQTNRPVDVMLVARSPPSVGQNEVERDILNRCQQPARLQDVYNNSVNGSVVEAVVESTKRRLVNQGLLRNEEDMRYARAKFFIIWMGLLALGGAKLYLGLSNEMPTLFLFLLMIAFGIITPLVAFPKRITKSGEQLLKETQQSLGWVQYEMSKGRVPEGADAGLAVAAFGAVALAAYPQMIWIDRNDAGFASGCAGGGCSGGTGGGCGGGGCGGCGGGGCGGGGCGGG